MEIEVRDAVKCFGPTAVIDHIDMQFKGGRVYGFQGINGSGKTMLMRLIAGLIYPTSGEVVVDGKALEGKNCFPESMGLLIENPAFLDRYSGYENLLLLAEIKGKISGGDVKRAMLRVGLDPDGNGRKKYRQYSLGMKQRLGIACAVMEAPELLLLDEPFLSLDEDGIATVLDIIRQEKERGALIILACHDYEMLSDVADEIFRLTAGKVTRHIRRTPDGGFAEVEAKTE